MKALTRSQLTKKLQSKVNKYVRVRDYDRPCISCGCYLMGDENKHKRNAGHYHSVGARHDLRFNTLNIHLQCVKCNMFKSGNLIEYRKGLVEIYGKEFAEELDYMPMRTEKYSMDDLRRLHSIFDRKIKLYERLFR